MNDVIEKMAEAYARAPRLYDPPQFKEDSELNRESAMRAALTAAEEHGYVLVPKKAVQDLAAYFYVPGHKMTVSNVTLLLKAIADHPKL